MRAISGDPDDAGGNSQGSSESQPRKKKKKDKKLKHSDVDFLMHHGIKGQKWGVRRFQNDDGSWTQAGKVRYGSASGSSSVAVNPSKPSWDHSKSNKSSAAKFAAKVALDVLTLNPIALTTDVTRGVQAVAASSKEKNEEKRKSELSVDKETGLRLKSGNFTPEQDLKVINPGFRNFDANTKNNCMLCTTAYEMRRRGYDVSARKASYGYTHNDLKAWFPKVEVKQFESDPFSKISKLKKDSDEYKTEMKQLKKSVVKASLGMNLDFANKVVSELEKQPNGSRGNLMVRWANGSGHSMIYEVNDGKVTVRDAQVNKTIRNPKSVLVNTYSATYARTDNLEFDKKRIKEAVA